MASAALSIDMVLPAFSRIRTEFGLPADSAATAGLITAFFLGMSLGQIPAGLVADRVGRRRMLFGGAALYIAGALGSAVAPSLRWIIILRFIWGLGAAAMRVASVAMLRDRFSGAAMAREMAFVMTLFIMVPIVAPAIGSVVVKILPWRSIFVICASFGLLLTIWQYLRMPETLARANRQPLDVRQVWVATKAILASRPARMYTFALIPLQACFSSYLASSERVIGEAFDRPGMFPVFFGLTALGMGVASTIGGRSVERIGLHRLIRGALAGFTIAAALAAGLSLAGDGKPNFWAFFVVFGVALALYNVCTPNLNSAAMVPVGHVAGTAAAVIGTVSMATGSVIGIFIDRAFDGTANPLTVTFFVSGALALVLAALAERRPGSTRAPAAA